MSSSRYSKSSSLPKKAVSSTTGLHNHLHGPIVLQGLHQEIHPLRRSHLHRVSIHHDQQNMIPIFDQRPGKRDASQTKRPQEIIRSEAARDDGSKTHGSFRVPRHRHREMVIDGWEEIDLGAAHRGSTRVDEGAKTDVLRAEGRCDTATMVVDSSLIRVTMMGWCSLEVTVRMVGVVDGQSREFVLQQTRRMRRTMASNRTAWSPWRGTMRIPWVERPSMMLWWGPGDAINRVVHVGVVEWDHSRTQWWWCCS